jgi:two-component system chemotaxis response regulator CheY
MGAPEDRRSPGPPLQEGSAALVQRLRSMGLEVRGVPGTQTAIVTLPFGAEPLLGPDGPLSVRSVRFATVGADRIKCLEPACLFRLPLVGVGACGDAASLEVRIRAAWNARMTALRRVRDSLARIGVTPEDEARGSVVAFEIGSGEAGCRARAVEPGRVILPGRGPLGGVALTEPADRAMAIDASLGSAVDLEISITNRLEQLGRAAARRAERQRFEAVREDAGAADAPRARRPRLLLVGPRLGARPTLAESLRVRGFEVALASGGDDALAAFSQRSFELVFVDALLGRDEGLELVPALRGLAGIARLPVILVDDHARPQRREAARRAGASGYLVHPLDAGHIAPGMRTLLSAPKRRFSRYPRRIGVRVGSTGPRGYTTAIGRMGMFLCTGAERPLHGVDRYELWLPELGSRLRVEAETVYRIPMAEGTSPGVGLIFRRFEDGDEATWIRWLSAFRPG